MMDTSERDAAVAALRAAGQPVTEMSPTVCFRTALPTSRTEAIGFPSTFSMRSPGASFPCAGPAALTALTMGISVVFVVLRNSSVKTIAVTTVSSVSDRRAPAVGVTIDTGYRYTPTIATTLPSGEMPPVPAIRSEPMRSFGATIW
jgi:PDZ domain-containing protein